MKIGAILNNDLANGEGIRTSVFVSGCPHHCHGCHNPELWDYNVGTEMTENTINQIKSLLVKDNIKRGLSILGGEPLAPENLSQVTALCREIKQTYPEMNIWLWTGYSLQEIKFFDIINYIDVIVDGKFEESLIKGNHLWRGSSNQKIYKIKNGQIIEQED